MFMGAPQVGRLRTCPGGARVIERGLDRDCSRFIEAKAPMERHGERPRGRRRRRLREFSRIAVEAIRIGCKCRPLYDFGNGILA